MSATGLVPVPSSRGDRLTDRDLERLARRLGVLPREWTRTREQGFVLAALNRRPLGVRSKRAVARAANISPTSAGSVIDQLIDEGLVSVERIRTVEGSATDVDVYVINRRSPEWEMIAELVRSIRPPDRAPHEHRPTTVPHRLWQHFWNADPARLELPRDAAHIASRLLPSRDPQAIAWATSHLDAAALASVADLRGFDAADRNLFRLLAAQEAA